MTKKKITPGLDIATEFGLAPAEAPARLHQKQSKLVIGVPKACSFQDKRCALTPQSVSLLVARGHEVIVETRAGEDSNFYDADYTEAGGQIVYSIEEVYKAKTIIQVAPPRDEEIELMKPGQIFFSPLHLPTLKGSYIKRIMAKKVTAVAFEYLKDQAGTYPMVRSMGEIAGNTAILIAAENLSNVNNGQGILLGSVAGVPPAKVVILGAGVVGEYASRTAIGLGAMVQVFDNSIYKLMRLQNNIGTRLYTSIIQPDILMEQLKDCDVVIGAIHAKEGRSPIVVTEAMVSHMKEGAVIIDVSIDQGGCFETSKVTSHDNPIFKKHGITHYCVPNIASRVAKTASLAYSNIITPTLLRGSEFGNFDDFLWNDSGVRHGLYIYNGSLTNQYLADKFDIKFTDLDLLFAANL